MASPRAKRIIALLTSLHRVMRERTKPPFADPFTFLRFRTLLYVKDHKNPLMKDIALHLAITPPSATSLVNSLVQSKLLERKHDKKDRRLIRLTITPKGRRVVQEKFREMSARMENVLSHLNTKEQESLVKILEKIAHNHE